MLRRLALLGALGAAAAAAQDASRAQAARRLVLDASRALQAGEAPRFVGYFDRRAPRLERLRENVAALCAQSAVASSVDVRVEAEEEGVVRLAVDWLLQLTPIEDVGAVERRREILRVHVGETRGQPRIVLLEPVDFFRPAPPR